MTKKKINSYTVSVDITLSTTVDIKAESFEEALAEARELKVPDVVEFEGDYCDGDIAVSGVFKI